MIPMRTPFKGLILLGITALAAATLGACHDCPAGPDECSMILVNPGFETIIGPTQHPGYEGLPYTGVEGWSLGPGAPRLNSPDIFDSPQDVPSNFMGVRTPLEGGNYAGISQGNNRVYYNESLMGTLQPAPGNVDRTYTVSAWFSTGSTRPVPSDVEIILINSTTGAMVQVVEGRIPNTQQWTELRGSISTTLPFDRIILCGIDTSPNGHSMSYTFVDKVSVDECTERQSDREDGLF